MFPPPFCKEFICKKVKPHTYFAFTPGHQKANATPKHWLKLEKGGKTSWSWVSSLLGHQIVNQTNKQKEIS